MEIAIDWGLLQDFSPWFEVDHDQSGFVQSGIPQNTSLKWENGSKPWNFEEPMGTPLSNTPNLNIKLPMQSTSLDIAETVSMGFPPVPQAPASQNFESGACKTRNASVEHFKPWHLVATNKTLCWSKDRDVHHCGDVKLSLCITIFMIVPSGWQQVSGSAGSATAAIEPFGFFCKFFAQLYASWRRKNIGNFEWPCHVSKAAPQNPAVNMARCGALHMLFLQEKTGDVIQWENRQVAWFGGQVISKH